MIAWVPVDHLREALWSVSFRVAVCNLARVDTSEFSQDLWIPHGIWEDYTVYTVLSFVRIRIALLLNDRSYEDTVAPYLLSLIQPLSNCCKKTSRNSGCSGKEALLWRVAGQLGGEPSITFSWWTEVAIQKKVFDHQEVHNINHHWIINPYHNQ